MTPSPPRILGIRHHGPGSARSLRHALEELRPDCILIEGPPDAENVLALATHGAGAGTAEWIQLEQFPSMWSQIIRDFLAGDTGPGLHVNLERTGDEIRVVAEYLDPAGAPLEQRVVTATIGTEGGETFPLEEAGPGRYEGTFAVGGPGTYHVAVAAEEAAADAERAAATEGPADAQAAAEATAAAEPTAAEPTADPETAAEPAADAE